MRGYKKIKHLEKEILELQQAGKTYREIGEQSGYSREQVRELVKRYRRRISSYGEGKGIPKKQGRPRKRPLTTQEDYMREINRLKMESELLRSFLQAAGRR